MLFKFTLNQFNFKYVYLGISILVFKIYFKSRHAYTPLVVKTGTSELKVILSYIGGVSQEQVNK